MLKLKQLCQFTVAKDVVISYFRCLEKHRKKLDFFLNPLTKLSNILLDIVYVILRNVKKKPFGK